MNEMDFEHLASIVKGSNAPNSAIDDRNDFQSPGLSEVNEDLSEMDEEELPTMMDSYKRMRLENVAEDDTSSTDSVQIKENVKWLRNPDANDLSPDLLDGWLKSGERTTPIDTETKFCDPSIVQQISIAKTTCQQFSRCDIETARVTCNPFDAVKTTIFQNRTAVTIANIDATLGFMFSNPTDENGQAIDVLQFADVSAGSGGGFSEYVLWRRKRNVRGYRFAVPKANDMTAGTETLTVFPGVKADGNILDPLNIQSLQEYVLDRTNGTGVHFLMADGGSHVADENKTEEIFHKNVCLCQCLAALSLVRPAGHCIVKLFDVFTPFTAGLVYLMHKCFQEIVILKPNASRPDCSERFLIGKSKNPNTDSIRDHLTRVNQEIWNNRGIEGVVVMMDCREIVPHAAMEEDRNFVHYLCHSNNTIGRRQLASLLKIIDCCSSKKLTASRQEDIRDECLQAWQLPNVQRTIVKSTASDETFKRLMNQWFRVKQFMLSPDQELSDESDLFRIFSSASDWFFVPVGTVEETEQCMRTFFMSLGGYDVYYYSIGGRWKPLRKISLEMSGNTLIYGDIVTEINDSDKSSVTVLHIIDGMVLGGEDVRHLPLQDRLKMCATFADSLNKPSRSVVTSPISFKQLHPMTDFRTFFDQLSYCQLKDGRKRLGYKTLDNCSTGRWYVPGGLLFFNNMKPNIEKAFSKTYQKEYFVDRSTGKTFFADQMKDPKAIYSSFKTTFVNRWLWEWKLQSQVYGGLDGEEKINGFLYRCDLDEFIYE